jgi:hypothetical protein
MAVGVGEKVDFTTGVFGSQASGGTNAEPGLRPKYEHVLVESMAAAVSGLVIHDNNFVRHVPK